MPQIEPDKVPHIEVLEWQVEQIGKEIKIAEALYDYERMAYIIVLERDNRNCQVRFSREFLEDLPDLSVPPSSSYRKTMYAKLIDTILEPIERNGVIPFSKNHLKIHIYEHIRKITESARHVNKINVLGRSFQPGSLESFLKVKFNEEERNNAYLAWEELRRQGIIVPTYEDIINPEDWVGVANIAPESHTVVTHLFLSSTTQDMIDLRAALISDLQGKGIKVEYSESSAFAALSTEDVHDICLDKVADTPVFLLIVGQRYGSNYAGKRNEYKGLSVVHAELRVAAGDVTKPLLIFVRDPVKYEYEFWLKNPTAVFEGEIEVFKMLQEIHAIANRKIWIEGFRDVEELKIRIFERLKSGIPIKK